MALRIVADARRCIGAGQCVMSAPDLFDQDDGGTVVVLNSNPAEGDRPRVDEAVHLCPSSTITVVED